MQDAAAFPERPSAPQFIRAPRTRRGLRALWVALIATVGISFAALLYFGAEIYQMAPPVPEAIETTNGQLVFDQTTIHRGQDVWRSVGGHELGSIWGHGAYTAPDWTADWLHREAVWLAETWSRSRHGIAFDDLDPEQSAALQARLQTEMRTNTYNPDTGVITVSADRARAIEAVQSHYMGLFGDDPALHQLREDYAMPGNVIPDAERREAFTAFIFWATWATVTERPGQDITYTHNWPPDDLVGNHATPVMVVTSVISFVLLLGGIGGLAWFFAASRDVWRSQVRTPAADPLIGIEPTPSMNADP